jgi:hypothetical protein
MAEKELYYNPTEKLENEERKKTYWAIHSSAAVIPYIIYVLKAIY